jgi:chorismate synthase
MLRYLTAGESHGPALVAIIDGFPAGLKVDIASIDAELRRRQGGYGRGARQTIEHDQVSIVSGVWQGETTGSPICLQIANLDHKLDRLKELPRPRPGHGDLAGAVKYLGSIRGVLERASARETAARVAAGALTQQLLAEFGICAAGYVVQIGGLELPAFAGSCDQLKSRRDQSQVYSLCPERDGDAMALIDQTKQAGDTLGGIVEVRVDGLPIGLGSHAQWDRKLDARLAAAVMSIQAIKGVEIGLGFDAAKRLGSQVHDPIGFDPAQRETPSAGYTRPTNNAGGIEAGISNGQPIVVRAAMKPISTLQKPLASIDLKTKQPESASYERSDICAVPACSVIVENVVAIEVAAALIDKFGGDSLAEMQRHSNEYLALARQR